MSLEEVFKPTGESTSYPRFLTPEETPYVPLILLCRKCIGADAIPGATRIFLCFCSSHRKYYLDYLRGWRRETECPDCRVEREEVLRRRND